MAGGEVIARAVAGRYAARRVAELLGAPTAVRLSRRPLALQAAERRLHWVRIDTDDRAAGPEAIRVHGRAQGIAKAENSINFDALDAEITVTAQWLTSLARQARAPTESATDAPVLTIGAITVLPKRRSLRVTARYAMPFGLTVDLRAVVALAARNGEIVYRITELSTPMSPFPIPLTWADTILSEMLPRLQPPELSDL